MQPAVYLILILVSGGRGDALSVFPKLFGNKADCEVAGAQWKENAKSASLLPKFVCFETLERARP